MATLKDVAKLACVDVSTVSRALNNSSYVHPATKEKILKAVEQLSYKPNLLAKGLRQGKKHTIGVVCPSIYITLFGEMTAALEKEARLYGYGVMICTTGGDAEVEAACLNRLRNGFVDGIVIASTGKNKSLLRDIKGDGISVVQMIRKQDRNLSSVVGDYAASAYDSVQYLYKKGCRQIGFINGSMEIIPYRERYKGYTEAMQELGLEEAMSKSEAPLLNNFEDGYKGAVYLLKHYQGLDGLMAANDLQCLGALRALKDNKVAVPRKVKVISLTGVALGGMLTPSMTSMEMPGAEMGIKAARLIIDDIEAPADNKPSLQHLVCAPKLAERETT